jgi:hypothetical protein
LFNKLANEARDEANEYTLEKTADKDKNNLNDVPEGGGEDMGGMI